MRRVSFEEYLEYAERHGSVEVGGVSIPLEPIRVERLEPSEKELDYAANGLGTTVWSFPTRGSWATHKGNYRGNWPPQMARVLIERYTCIGDTVLDPMIGSGTTCIEAKLLARNCIGVDINYAAVILTLHRLYWLEEALRRLRDNGVESVAGIPLDKILGAKAEIYHGDARRLDAIKDSSIHLVATHPPYYNIIRYGKKGSAASGDLSAARRLEDYLAMIRGIAEETMRVLVPGGHFALLVGDTRIRKHYVPISTYVLLVLLDTGYVLREEIVKIQHRMKTTRERWMRVRDRDFLLIYHEKLYVLRKPRDEKERRRYRYSVKPPWLSIELPRGEE